MTLRDAFADQAISCTRLGSPFMGRLLSILADHWPSNSRLGQYFATFTGDIGPSGASLPLRIAGGLHALVLSNQSSALAAVYPPNHAQDALLRDTVLTALQTHEGFLLDWVQSPPQTNEVRRSAALMPGAAVAGTYFDLPVWLSELGASGGLNLMWDHFDVALQEGNFGVQAPALMLRPDWDGPMPPTKLPEIAQRAGVDRNPLDPKNPADLLRLTAFLWPDQPERLALTRAAASVACANIARADAIDWLDQRLEDAPDNHMHLIQHTVAWQYFPKDAQDRGRALIEAAGKRATNTRPIAWLSLETDGDRQATLGAALTLRLWPGAETLHLGRADFHGRWVKWAGVT